MVTSSAARRTREVSGQQGRMEAAPRTALAVALALGIAGLFLSIVLTRLHASAHAGETSFCSISETVNCDRVATSRFSVVLGLPVSVWGAVGFGLAAALAASGLLRRRPHSTWPAGLLFVLGAFSAAVSVALALVSELAIGAWCLLCAGAWVVSFLLLASARRACRPQGVAGAVRADLAVLRAAPLRSAALAVALLGGIGVAAAAYPRYWDRPPAAPRPAAGSAAASATGPVIEYSDYECPFCARAHEQERAVLASRPGLVIVRRHFPLDPSCNPAVKRAIHPSACALARAAICAEAQGQSARMDDALFRDQGKGTPPAEIARALGLDVDRFSACLSSPETARRLSEDVAAGIRDGVRAIPTYLVDGTAHVGTLPPGLAAPAGTASGR
jgi:uncharacterized membrane protein/predicted DsbA family dithiol-disulfide isomerase